MAGIDAGRIAAQQLLDHAAAVRRSRASRSAASARRLPMLLLIETWSAACCCASSCTRCSMLWPELGQPLLDPAQRQRQRRALPLQAARHLGHERAGHRRIRARHVGDHQHHAVGIALGGAGHRCRPSAPPCGGSASRPCTRAATRRRFSIRASRSMIGIAHSSPSVSGVHVLVGADEAQQAGVVDAAVTVRNHFQRDVVDTRQSGRRPAGEPRQFAVVALAADAAGRCGSAPRSGRSCPAATRRPGVIRRLRRVASVSRSQVCVSTASLSSSRRQQAGRRTRVPSWCWLASSPAVPLHLLGAEQLRAQRGLLLRPDPRCGAPSPEGAQTAQLEQFEHAAHLQIRDPSGEWPAVGWLSRRRRGWHRRDAYPPACEGHALR